MYKVSIYLFIDTEGCMTGKVIANLYMFLIFYFIISYIVILFFYKLLSLNSWATFSFKTKLFACCWLLHVEDLGRFSCTIWDFLCSCTVFRVQSITLLFDIYMNCNGDVCFLKVLLALVREYTKALLIDRQAVTCVPVVSNGAH